MSGSGDSRRDWLPRADVWWRRRVWVTEKPWLRELLQSGCYRLGELAELLRNFTLYIGIVHRLYWGDLLWMMINAN